MLMKQDRPLEGLLVLDFTRVYSGPYCTMLLADLGATVLKVERKGVGDDSRQFLPLVEGRRESGYYIYYNRNKKSIELDLKDPAALEVVYRLAERADIVVENFAPGVADKLGIGYRQLRERSPRLIYGSISGFGQTGPYRAKAAYDIVAQAMGGYMAITGEKGGPPLKLGSSIADAGAGIHMAFALLAAVYYREKTGVGQYVDVSMLDVVFSTMENIVMLHTYGGAEPTREGNHNKGAAPFNTYPTRDGKYVCIAVANDAMFARCMQAIGEEGCVGDPRFQSNLARKNNEAALDEIVGRWTRAHDLEVICRIMDGNRVPVGPVREIRELCHDPQLLARDMLVTMRHSTEGDVLMPGSPFKYSETPVNTFRSSPLLGEDTREILRDYAGYAEAEIEALYRQGVIFQSGSPADGNQKGEEQVYGS